MSAALASLQTQPLPDRAPAAAQPTVCIGLGGTAAAVLKILRRRLAEGKVAAVPARRDDGGGSGRPPGFAGGRLDNRDGYPTRNSPSDDAHTHCKFLAIDTDRDTLQRAQDADDGAALLPDETLHLPLRKPAEYRQASDEILSWLSRRWLYNIPRSLRTDGLRPLGRLAFVDHRERIAECLRRLLAGQPPRVFILASIDGGAGGGMLLDVAYAVRQQLDQLKLRTDCFCGVMLHATLAAGTSNDLRKANAYATLTELNHFMQGGAAFRAGPVEVLPVGDVSEPPFHDAYLIHLGNELKPGDFDRSLDRVAEYLYLNATCGAAALDCFRRDSRQKHTADAPVPLRSFGVHAVRVKKQALARQAAERVCLRLVRSWSGEDTDESAARMRLQPPAFGLEQLTARLQSLADQALGGNAEAQFRTLLAGPDFAAAGDRASGSFGEVLARVHAVLGSPIANADQSLQSGRLQTMLAGGTKKLAAAIGQTLLDSIAALVDQPQARLPAALAGTSLYQEHLRDLRQAADQTLDREQAQAQSVLAQLERGGLPAERFWFSRFARTSAAVEDGLLAYCRSLLRLAIHRQTTTCLQEMMAMLAALNERLLALRQSLRWLAEEFAEPPTAEAKLAETDGPESAPTAQLDRLLQNASLAGLGDPKALPALNERGLLALADDSQRWRELARQLREAVQTALCAALDGADAGSLLVEQYPTPRELDAWCTAAVAKTAPTLDASSGTAPTANERFFLALPASSSHGQLTAAAERCLPSCTVLASDHCDLVLLRETHAIALSEIAARITESRDDCAEAARRVLTRVDVTWSPLPGQPVP